MVNRAFVAALAVSLVTFLPAQERALKLDGVVVEFPDHPAMRLGESFTIEFWVVRNGSTFSNSTIFERLLPGNEHRVVSLYSGSVHFLTWGSPWPDQVSSTGTWTSAWTHIAYVREPAGHALYRDGVAIATGGPGPCGPSCAVGEGSCPTRIGSALGAGLTIDELRVSNVARYHGPFTPQRHFVSDGATAMLLHFEELVGPTVHDASSHAQIGTVVAGMPQFELVGPAPTFAAYGTGCAGSAWQPVVQQDAGSLPGIGRFFRLQVANLPPSPWNVAFGVLGFRGDGSPGTSLPLELAGYGMPGCLQHVDPDPAGLFVLANGAGTANWSFAIPWQVGLIGCELHLQALVNLPGANAAGLITTAAARGTIGVVYP